MERIANITPLLPENQKVFDKIWEWFVKKRITKKKAPQVTSDKHANGYHDGEGTIAINENHDKKDFPLPALMVEEILHYIASGRKKEWRCPASSEDFSLGFLHFILRLIVDELRDKPYERRREFQSRLIRYMCTLVEADIGKKTG
jgi:hypothetical protein